MRIRKVLMLAVVFLLNLQPGDSFAQQPKPSPEPPRFPEAPASARIWKSLTTAKEYRVWLENDRLYAEWVNIATESARRGAYIRTECQRTGRRWIGISHSYLPCEQKDRPDYNWCHWVTKIEFVQVDANRMTGRAEGFKSFDCERCRILETVWKDFEWVPKEPSAVGSKQ